MPMSHIVNFLNGISESIGLSPIALFCAFALFFFVFVFSSITLIKIKDIRNNIFVLHRRLDSLFQMTESKTESNRPGQPNRKKVGVKSDIKSRILKLLQRTAKPVSYSDIVKRLSQDYPDDNYDYETVLEELDQLKGEGEIISQLYFGRLYFQINEIGL
jgi:hypothetical protein